MELHERGLLRSLRAGFNPNGFTFRSFTPLPLEEGDRDTEAAEALRTATTEVIGLFQRVGLAIAVEQPTQQWLRLRTRRGVYTFFTIKVGKVVWQRWLWEHHRRQKRQRLRRKCHRLRLSLQCWLKAKG